MSQQMPPTPPSSPDGDLAPTTVLPAPRSEPKWTANLTVHRADHSAGGFAQISNTLVEDSDLSWAAKGVLVYMLSRPPGWHFNVADLVNRAPDGRTAVLSVLKELIKRAYVTRTRTRVKGRYVGAAYVVRETPALPSPSAGARSSDAETLSPNGSQPSAQVELPRLGTPATVLPLLEFPAMGDATQPRLIDRQDSLVATLGVEGASGPALEPSAKQSEPQSTMIATPAGQATRFDEFWTVYPKKRAKEDCRKKWTARKLDAMADKIIDDVKERLVRDQRWLSGYVPDPHTYLHGLRWQDEFEDIRSDRMSNMPQRPEQPVMLEGEI